MPAYKTFSKRHKNEKIDVFKYDQLPEKFRNQVVHILAASIGVWDNFRFGSPGVNNNLGWSYVYNQSVRELGLKSLSKQYPMQNFDKQVFEYLSYCATDDFLDIVDISFNYIYTELQDLQNNDYKLRSLGITQRPKDALIEINERFYENSLGYQFQNGQINRVDSTYLHEQVVKTAFTLIHNEKYRGIEDEFRKAHDHYLHKRYKEALNEALKAYESTMKSICDQLSLSYPMNITANKLVELLFDNGFFPIKLKNQFTSLRSLLESGIQAIRNSESSHGQGPQIVETQETTVKLTLHLTATYIVFLLDLMGAHITQK